MTERTATTIWNGDLLSGSGEFTVGTGAIGPQGVTWAARTEEPAGKTSPEELIAAAHASCYAMAFSHHLASNGFAPGRVTVTATVGLGPKPGGGVQVTHSNLQVVGVMPGMTSQQFAAEAAAAEAGCPISNALRNNVSISVNASLE